ncbi:MAG TPA: glycosyltransferase family 9 protein [Flavobacterium sp.]
MGDVAMTVPVIRAFADQYPEVKITVISRTFFKPLFTTIPNAAFFPFDPEGKHKGFSGLLRLYSDIKKLEIDAFADLHNVLRSKVVSSLFALSGTKTATVDKARSEKKALTRTENKIFKPLMPIIERHAKVFEELGFPIDLSKPTFPENAHLGRTITTITGQKEDHQWIGIAPFAQYQSKVYPADLIQIVISDLAQNSRYKIFLFGSEAEIKFLDNLANGAGNVVVVAGKFNLEQELKLISNLDVMVSMDSANAHIAAIYGIKVITLWGATHPFAGFAPFNQPFDNALTSDRTTYPLLPTSVYGNKDVPGYEDAMRTITPEDVVEKIKSFL